MSDPIVDEVRSVREAYAARFNYDLDAIFRDIKDQEKKGGRKFVSFAGHPDSSESPASIAALSTVPPGAAASSER